MAHQFSKSLAAIICLAAWRVASAQGFSPDDAVRHMTAAPGLAVKLFASEPEVRQPIFVKCDDRGRLWTIQYLQYPNPAGLKRVKIDRWSRTVYDRVPEPPPRGPRGADKITILEDTNGDGRADKAKDFVDGLNLATGVEFGHGGVYVLQVPYLLFYPDANRDDVPDSDPEVLLTGFGMEDAQAMSNHLTWGPDGWLYGVNGSTTTCNIRGIEFQQGVWRFHPVTHEFELFCEGGSNCYGLTFDANGELYYSTNGGPFVHAVQGGYYYKSFGKHGPLHNLHAYYFFPELTRDQVPGGPPTGGTIYLGDTLPKEFRGTFIAGNFLGHTVSWWNLHPAASTVSATYGGIVLDSHDTWFGATDVCAGPDGALYVSDFYDQRTAHPDPDANWDRTNGRIYKIVASGAKPHEPIDIGALPSSQLIDLLSNPNHWYADRARVELAHRRDDSVVVRLRELARQTANHQLALEALWALNVTIGIDDKLAVELLSHPYEYVRFWTARFMGDRKSVSPKVAKRMIELAATEPSPVVRGQLAATAKRLPAADSLPIIESLLKSQPIESDPRIPWLIWWAIESKAISDAKPIIELFSQPAMWTNPAARENALRLVRRYAAEGTSAGYSSCLAMLKSTPAEHQATAHEQLRQGLAERAVGLAGIGQGDLFGAQAAGGADQGGAATRGFELVTGELRKYVHDLWQQNPNDPRGLELALRASIDDAYSTLTTTLFAPGSNAEQSALLFALLREFVRPDTVPVLIKFVSDNHPDAVKMSALDILARFDTSDITMAIVSAYRSTSSEVRSRMRDVLFARPASALAFLQLIDRGQLPESDVPVDQLRRLAVHKSEAIDALVHKHWGNIGPGTTEEKLATMRRYNNDLRAASGNVTAGQVLFEKNCGICHQLHNKGNKIGPDLTTANRNDREALLANIVDPSAVIRREYLNYIVVTTSGRVVSGIMAEQDGASIAILDAKNQRVKIARDEIDELREADVSLMPERILDPLSPQELRDLFAYLQGAPATK